MSNVRTRWIRTGIAAVALCGLAACSATYRNHGYVPSEADLSEIVVGVDTRDTVSETVGPPSSSGVLDTSGYYYVASRVRSFAFREPRVVERELVAISFDNSGVVQNIERFGLEDGRVIPLTRRVTSSSVSDNTFLRQLLGNLGRFAPDQFIDG
ncbi:outer membrane protein assembly factor BamE [Thalassococcus sp. S3]|uniref:outer membrane protein assembly factor BamE n=1 Tax=Thalassococcus sp. S3 TaxID=2017482 RepID=UPI0010242857|nr:outer membrane protein assembly factor BamE [Thalassococcus sp. S3]QBF31586.1 cell envelope protein SmpA [Thalassococcus sp. S3]